jgi:hypothetical protein
MKKTSSIAICILLLCSLVLMVNAGTTMASEPGYTFTEYYGDTATVDGKWTTVDEWHDVTAQRIGTPQVAVFEYKMDVTSGTLMTWLLEFADNTNDAGDRWQICIDGANDGGTAPNSNDLKFEISGHTTLNVYAGTGSGWAATTATVTWTNTLTTSPHDPSTHWVLELQFEKGQFSWGANMPPHGVRAAMYDASNDAQGWVAWPPEAISKDNPSRWGLIDTAAAAPAPEGLTIGIMVLVSSAALLSASYYLRKRPKITNLLPTKL